MHTQLRSRTLDSTWAHERAKQMAVPRVQRPQEIDLPLPDGITTGRVHVVPANNWETPESQLAAIRASLVAAMLYGFEMGCKAVL